MKNKALLILMLTLFSTFSSKLTMLFAQGTAFTYQGLLTVSGVPANGSNDLTFTLYNAAIGGATVGTSNVVNGLAVTNGLFSVTLDYGVGVFDGNPRWLQIAARPAGAGSYTNLIPRQQITATPYAIFAGSSSNLSGKVTSGGLSGSYTNGLTLTNGANVFKGTYTGNGAGVTNVNAAQLGGLAASNFWQLGGNTGTAPGDFLGTADNQPLELVVNGFTALRLEPNSMASPNLIGGRNNTVAAGVYAATIGGGLNNNIQANSIGATIAGGELNNIGTNSSSSTIGGGDNNSIQTNSASATIAGGESNVIQTNSNYSFLGGGLQNRLQANTSFSTLGGGNGNSIQASANYATISGGKNNTIGSATSVISGGEANTVQAGADRSAIGGGLQNVTTGSNGTVPGGFANSAFSFALAAGRRAKANNIGSFVWADTTDADFASSVDNQVNMRASGGYRLFSNGAATLGVSLAANGTSWGSLCDRNAKKNFVPVDGVEVLEKLARLPVQQWNYKWEPDGSVPHIGPMAQDFKSAFYPGRDDKVITTLEFDGVELAAIKGLNQKLSEQEAALKNKESEIQELRQVIAELQKTVRKIASKAEE